MALDKSAAYLLHRLVSAMDRAADQMLRTHLGISYKRALFLIVLHECGTVTQHELAVALEYSDPAVSTMLLELAKDGYVRTTPSETHGRKHLVTLTPKGSELVTNGRQLLDARFDELLREAGVDAQHYRELTNQVYQTLVANTKKEQQS